MSLQNEKVISATLASIMFMGSVATSALAATPPEVSATANSISEISTELKQKASPYITLEGFHFKLASEATKELNADELTLVKGALKTANQQARTILNDSHVRVTIDTNSIKVTPVQSSSEITINSINTSSYWDYELLWWGYRIFLSHNLIEDVKSRPLYIAGSAAISTGLLNASLTYFGLPGWIANIIVGVTLVKGGTILYADAGKGVYIDTFWSLPGSPSGVINFALSEVYAAW
ncbi:hypothetical protein [Paenibacillus silvae]|uniref:hypothetical protein n=1 Tax=Paenibacillus silvae TaxID=1325358 RepID=UPI0020036D37|nr:hypothetical protein [Paenibacillus silvae]MCK6078511.1 hypothetical protein [Paenibacillus silvae]MCK6152831.1 hypothetical protein [Paenibacillus silvae]MCK6271283.1 hypothetical protein [Paenibacillus silvae]